MRRFTLSLFVIAALFTTTDVLHAQSAQIPAPPQTRAVLIRNAVIHPASDELPETITGWVLFQGGRIQAMGDSPVGDLPPNTEIIDAAGLHLVPGFLALSTQLGLVETSQVEATDDQRESGDRTPETAPWVAVNPDSDLIPVARSAGILHSLIMPTGGTIPGRASMIRLDGWTTEDLVVLRDAGLVVRWPLSEPFRAPWMRRNEDQQRDRSASQRKEIEQFFDDAIAWRAAREADPTTPGDLRFEAMQSILSGQRPVFMIANSRGQIESSLAWASQRGLRPVILGGANAMACIPTLKETGAAVIIDGVHRLPMARHSAWDEPFALAASLHEAGVPFAIAPGDEPAHIRSLVHGAATAAAHGLPRDVALRAITRNAAEISGVGERLGRIDPGHSATFFLCDGDPLEMSSPPLVAWIDGRQIDLGDRQKRMFEKYREKYRQQALIEQ